VSEQKAAAVTDLGGGRFRLDAGGQQRLAYGVASGTAVWIFLDGRTFVVDTAPVSRRRRGGHHDDATALSSPMPATVVSINVKPGDAVARGDVMITLEAMKMEVPIKAPRDARVAAVKCRAGELVQPGVLLLELE
jgi:biotin carboxyl carrier protein